MLERNDRLAIAAERWVGVHQTVNSCSQRRQNLPSDAPFAAEKEWFGFKRLLQIVESFGQRRYDKGVN